MAQQSASAAAAADAGMQAGLGMAWFVSQPRFTNDG